MFSSYKKSPVTLLALFAMVLSSMIGTAFADARADYQSLGCARSGCHGPTAPGNINVGRFTTQSELAGYIDVYMPKDNVGACKGTCAQRMAEYLRSINLPPVAKTQSGVTVGPAPLSAVLTGSGSSDDHGIVSYTWNFGDGQTGQGDATNNGIVSHTYSTNGTYTATLTVADEQGLTAQSSISVYVVSTRNPPTIDTSKTSALSGVSPFTVNFDASLSSCTGGCTYFSWDFGVGSGSGATASHTFTAPGTYSVELRVYDGGALSSTKTLTVTVTASTKSPVANASKSSNLIGAVPLKVKFVASLSSCANECSNFAWNFGDGETASGSSSEAVHSYSQAGTYTATLTATDKSNGKTHSASVPVKVVPSESLTTYVQACQSDLQFPSIPDLNCYDGDLFATPEDPFKNIAVNDFLGYKKITDQVDLTFACRWLFGNKVSDPQAPVSIEMMLHNRQSGSTCFFSAKGQVSGAPALTSADILSPTGSSAEVFWDAPASVDAHVRCVGCHVSGPYIATPLIAPFLSKYGLLNDGHDTLSNVTAADLATPNQNVKYHVVSGKESGVPGAFSQWDKLKHSYINPEDSKCALGCHVIGTSSPQDSMRLVAFELLANPAAELSEIHYHNVMKPYAAGNDYRWINLDTPGNGVESETFAAANNATTTSVPKLFSAENGNCPQPNVPTFMEAHAVGNENTFVVPQPGRFAFVPDRLSVFNLKQGLVCLHADQDAGQRCQDYRVHYECTDANGKKDWTEYLSTDTTDGDGDREERNSFGDFCAAVPDMVAPVNATAIEAEFTVAGGWTYSSIGPNDRLASFSPYGLTCNDADQPDGQCSNYVVRYSTCVAPPVTVNKILTNVFAVGKELTAASNSLVKGQGHNNNWNTQQWAIEPIKNTEYVRLKNTGTNVYLNVASAAESATVGTASSNNSTNQMWLVETISGTSAVRLKNVFSGKYLTMADPAMFPNTPDYLPVFSQARNTGWTSQHWMMR